MVVVGFKAFDISFLFFFWKFVTLRENPRKNHLWQKARRASLGVLLKSPHFLPVQDKAQYFAKPRLISNEVFPKKEDPVPALGPFHLLFVYMVLLSFEWGRAEGRVYPQLFSLQPGSRGVCAGCFVHG